MDREEALRKMARALSEYVITGVATTIPFCSFVLSHPKFIEGNYDIRFVEKYYQPGAVTYNGSEELAASFIAAYCFFSNIGNDAKIQRATPGRWKNNRFEE